MEQITLDFDVTPHIGFTKSQFRGFQQFLLGDVLVDDHREFRLAFPDGVLLAMDLHIEAVLVEMTQIIDEKVIHDLMQHSNHDSLRSARRAGSGYRFLSNVDNILLYYNTILPMFNCAINNAETEK